MLVNSDVLIWYLRGRLNAAQFLDAIPAIQPSAVSDLPIMLGTSNTGHHLL